ncbi:MAG: sortase [Gaiellaceae bacterium]
MRGRVHLLGTLLAVAGVLVLGWALLVWQWQDPFTALYTTWKQHQLASQYDKRARTFTTTISGPTVKAERASIAREAKRYRLSSKRGQVIGRIRVPRMGINMLLVNGTDHDTLKKGPGRDGRTFMPGENRLIYIAGHRTTYLAPFSHIDRLRRGDRVTIEVPYATFIYAVTRHRIVKSTDLSVLRSPRHELVELQACHPRFFATHRYIAYAKLLRVEPRGAKPYELTAQASGK